MLYVRVVSPVAQTESLTDLLAAAPGVHNLVVRAGAARRPPGDAVQFDVSDAAANPVLARWLDFSGDGEVTIRTGKGEYGQGIWTALGQVAAEGDGGPAVAALARARIQRAFRNVVRRGNRIAADSPSEQVHELRKRCKELRYLLEVFRPLCADDPYRPLIKELKSLQDTLGEFQDGEVQREAVREFAAAMMEQGAAPPATVLAMGELAAQLDAHQLNARGALVGVLRPFLAKENRARVKALMR